MLVLFLSFQLRTADALHAANKVLCMGQGGSILMAAEACHLFATVSGKFFAVQDSHTQLLTAVNMDPGDLLFFFSYSGATRDMMETMQAAKKSGAKIPSGHALSAVARRKDLGLYPALRIERKPASARLGACEDRAAVFAGSAVYRVLQERSRGLRGQTGADYYGDAEKASVGPISVNLYKSPLSFSHIT